jgi:hypothetical protein
MKHILEILTIPSAIILLAYIAAYIKHRKEIDKLSNDKMREYRKKHPPKKFEFTGPLSMWND